MSKTIRDSAWKQAKWAQEMIPVLKAAGFEYEKFSYDDQFDWQEIVTLILDKQGVSYNYQDATAVMFFFLAHEFRDRMIRGMNAKEYLSQLGIAYIHDNHTLVNSYVAGLIEDDKFKEIYKYQSTRSKTATKIKDLNLDKQKIEASVRSLNTWTAWLIVILLSGAGLTYYMGMEEVSVYLGIFGFFVLVFRTIRGSSLTNRADAISEEISMLNAPKEPRMHKLILILILLGVGVWAVSLFA
jgi:hypothetical protein